MENTLNKENKTCSDEYTQKIVEIFEKCKNGIPKSASFEDMNGNVSYGFYTELLVLEKYNTDPNLFFQILEIDQKIGWSNPDHIEYLVFEYKGIKIIQDENVRFKLKKNNLKNCQNFQKNK